MASCSNLPSSRVALDDSQIVIDASASSQSESQSSDREGEAGSTALAKLKVVVIGDARFEAERSYRRARRGDGLAKN
jgi:hypothetical protein